MAGKRTSRTVSLKKVIAVALAVLVAVTFYNMVNRLNYYNGQIKDLESKISEEKSRNSELADKKSKYSSKEHIEEVARDTLGLVRANEKVYIDSNNHESN